MSRVAVIGSAGQLGRDLVVALKRAEGNTVIPLTRAEIECTDITSVQRVLREMHPQVVINCAAFVRVDECEDRPEEAFRVNALGALHVARGCAEIGAACVYISTDYVFNGTKQGAYTEDDPPAPINVHGTSKLAGEYLVRQTVADHIIVRLASLFGAAGASGKGGNFVQTILAQAKSGNRIRVVNDIRMSPTYTADASVRIVRLIQQRACGIFHLTNAGSCSWFEFAQKILGLAGVRPTLVPVSSTEYQTRARRPSNSALISRRLGPADGYPMRPWEAALEAYLVEKGYLPQARVTGGQDGHRNG